MNQKKNVPPHKKVGGGGSSTLREEDNPTRTSRQDTMNLTSYVNNVRKCNMQEKAAQGKG